MDRPPVECEPTRGFTYCTGSEIARAPMLVMNAAHAIKVLKVIDHVDDKSAVAVPDIVYPAELLCDDPV